MIAIQLKNNQHDIADIYFVKLPTRLTIANAWELLICYTLTLNSGGCCQSWWTGLLWPHWSVSRMRIYGTWVPSSWSQPCSCSHHRACPPHVLAYGCSYWGWSCRTDVLHHVHGHFWPFHPHNYIGLSSSYLLLIFFWFSFFISLFAAVAPSLVGEVSLGAILG